MTMVKFINLKTGEVMEVDYYKLRELGAPDGFHAVEEVSSEQWIVALQDALNQSK